MNYLAFDSDEESFSKKKKKGSENDGLVEVDNSQSVLQKMASMYAEQLMSDMTLEVGGSSYPAHRLILCASSDVFQVMLMNREWSESRESKIVLQETPTATSVFPHFLKYFYTGQIRISHQSVLPVLSLADKYNVKDLVTLCLDYMAQNMAHAAKGGHLISWMQYTMACGHSFIAKECQNFLKWNLQWVWSYCDMDELEGDTLVQMLQQSDLVLHNEMTLYYYVVRWLKTQRVRLADDNETAESEKPAHWESLVTAVFTHIRFPMMCPKQLAELLLCPLITEHKEFFMDRMAIAMSYQSGQSARLFEIKHSESGRMLFTPRLYTEDTWGSVLSVDNFHSMPSYHTSTCIFSSRPAIVENPDDKPTEWTVDLYPKGVWFKKSLLINWAGNYDVPEVVLRTVRVAITCKDSPDYFINEYGDTEELDPDVRVMVGILIWGVQNGVEYISKVIKRVHRFCSKNRVLNIDNALDFDELNTPLYTPAHARFSRMHCCAKRCPPLAEYFESPHLVGPCSDELRVQVVIVPLTNYSTVVDME